MATPYATCPDDQRTALQRAVTNAAADWAEKAISEWPEAKVKRYYDNLREGRATLELQLPLEDPGFAVVLTPYGCREAHDHHDVHPDDDSQMGAYVYCKSHVGPHVTGWCTVFNNNKIPLEAQTQEEAFEEVKKMGLPIHGRCRVCYKFIANEHPWAKECPEHEDE